MMTECPREISHAFSVEENIAKENPTVLHGTVCAERVAKRITLCLNAKRKRRHNLKVKDASSEEEFLYYVTTKSVMPGTVNSVSEREICTQMLINEKPVRFYIYCGATVNVLPSKFVNQEKIFSL